MASVVAAVAMLLTPGSLEYLPDIPNPLGLSSAGPALGVISQVAFVAMAAVLFAAVGSMIVRWRRARGVERQQLKWLAYAAAIAVLAQVGSSFLPRGLFLLATYTAVLLFPAATGIAIVRYRLYDIDRIISRTVVYATLTALLASVYVGTVLVVGQLFGSGAGTPDWVVAGATLAVAALFQPALRRIQTVVDRRFNRRRYDAARTVNAFAARARDEVDLDTLLTELLAVVDQTMQPTQASSWLRPAAR